jgi:formylglycine-generating enzyme required for sulfatase activity
MDGRVRSVKRTLSSLVFICALMVAFLWHATGAVTRTGQGASNSSGDVNGDGLLDISDPVYILQYLFSDGPPPGACQSGPVAARQVTFEPQPDISSTNVQDALAELNQRLQRLEGPPQSIEIALVDIPAGSFIMGYGGSDPTWAQREGPLHRVTITKAFKMGATEVTQAQFLAVMGWNPSAFAGCPECPVENVNWFDAQAFCRILTEKHRAEGKIPDGASYRLPTEAEWEYACRAGTSTNFFFGDEQSCINNANVATCSQADEYLWWNLNSPIGLGPKPVGQKSPNPWGLHDMLGNVWEWCEDWHAPYPSGPATDPKGPASGNVKVARGGGWSDDIGSCRSSGVRNEFGPTTRSSQGFLGFRIVLESP